MTHLQVQHCHSMPCTVVLGIYDYLMDVKIVKLTAEYGISYWVVSHCPPNSIDDKRLFCEGLNGT